MKICIFGAGAVGGHLAARLIKGGEDVTVISRGPRLGQLRDIGLVVEASDGVIRERVRAEADPGVCGPQDLVVVPVKAPSLPALAPALAPLLKDGTAVMFAMNGIPWWYNFERNDEGGWNTGPSIPQLDSEGLIQKHVSPERVIGCVVHSACDIREDGSIYVPTKRSRLVVGEPDGVLSRRIRDIAEAFGRGGLDVDVTDVIRDAVWHKLVTNLAGALISVATSATIGAIYSDPGATETAGRMIREAEAAAVALGRRVRIDVDEHVRINKVLRHKASMLQDLEAGRPMEIKAMLDAYLALAATAGVRSPTIESVGALARLRALTAGCAL